MPTEQSNKGMKRWTIPICNCGGIVGSHGAPRCRCSKLSPRRIAHPAVIPASSPNVLSEEEAGLIVDFMDGNVGERGVLAGVVARLKEGSDRG